MMRFLASRGMHSVAARKARPLVLVTPLYASKNEIDDGELNTPEETVPAPDHDEATTATTSTTTTTTLSSECHPAQVVEALDQHIVGQANAKKAVAIALRNRWRRRQLQDENMRKEVTPRNVLLVGPTGCGKTEVARRMAALQDAPFLKVEATKFTEVGYHGRDVDQIVRDIMDVSMQLTKQLQTQQFTAEADVATETELLSLLTGPENERSHESFRDMLRQGVLDDQEVEIEVAVDTAANTAGKDNMPENVNIIAMTEMIQKVQGNNKKVERKTMPIGKARPILREAHLERLLESVDLKTMAVQAAEENGIVFIDEIDKICSARDMFRSSSDASSEGVQRDLLPLVEGTTVQTRYGNVKTDYMLFIASGAFHSVKPSDLLPELQGRLPVQVSLQGLTSDDLYRILTEPVANLLQQQQALLSTEGVTLEFNDDAIRTMASSAAHLNKHVENIGARRLHTVVEQVMEPLSFETTAGETVTVTQKMVEERLQEMMKPKKDLQKYIL